MSGHVSESTLVRLRQRELPPNEIVAVMRHVAECAECSAIARNLAEPDVVRVREVLADAAVEPEHDVMDEAHLEKCEVCRADIADLRNGGLKPRPAWWIGLAAAAIFGLIAVLLLQQSEPEPALRPAVIRTTPPVTKTTPAPPPPEAPRYANDDWAKLVEDVLASGRLPSPRHPLPRNADELRGAAGDADIDLAPSGTAIDSTRPGLTWPRVANATYAVSIFAGDDEVAHSEPLQRERWTPPRDLARGRTYTWQVVATVDGVEQVLPSPPAPPAMFRILSAREHDELADARRSHPDDALLLAALYARSGMRAEAEQVLRESRDPRVRDLRW